MTSSLAGEPEVRRLFAEAVRTQSLIRLVLSKPRGGAAAPVNRVAVRPVALGTGAALQFTFHRSAGGDTHENVGAEAAVERLLQLLTNQFAHAHLFTSQADYSIRARAEGKFKLKSAPASKGAEAPAHNRQKQYLLPEGIPVPFLVEIGVMNRDGKVLAAKFHKFRQINRFLELVDDALGSLPRDRALRVLDFGSGKSYLTFALHHLLTQIRGYDAHLTGVDRNVEVIGDCQQIAARLQLCGLEFATGDIDTFPLSAPVDLVVSLHACDTATDDVLAQAIQAECSVILSAPCCQHELAGQIRLGELAPLEGQGIIRERFAALATDTLRAEVLGLCGYQAQIVEFIDLEHTAKNLLIRAVRRPRPSVAPERVARYDDFKRALGIETFHLERALGRDFLRRLSGTVPDEARDLNSEGAAART